MGKHCGTCTCKNTKSYNYQEYPCEYCGKLCKRKTRRALCSLQCRLLGNVKQEGSCLIWQGKIGMDGYGLIMIGGKRQRAHRLSFSTFNGDIPEERIVCHSCDNPACINPKHLFHGTHEDNMYDMVTKGRSSKGNQYTRGYRKMTCTTNNKLRKE